MKKFLLIFLDFLLILNMAGCSKKTESKTNSDFEIKGAQVLTDNYLKYNMRKDTENAKKLLGKGLDKNLNFDPNLDIWGYSYDEISQVGNSGILKIFILKGSPDKAYSILEKYNIKVEKVDGDYKITEIVKKPDNEVFLEGNNLRIKEKDQLEAKLLLNKGSIPKYASSKDNKANTYSMQVSSNAFGPIAVSYSGEKVVFSTDNMGSCYFALVTISSIKETSGEGGGQKQQDQQQGQQGQQTGNVEKPVGEKLIDLDYLTNSKISLISFTPDEKYVIIGYKGKAGNSLRIYYSASGELIKYKFEDNFNQDKYNVSFSFCDKKFIYFSVSTINNEPDDKTGSYRMKMEDFKVDRI
ncbi:MAG: hypothetical protein WCQ54_11725 [Clostridiaceae bacterium]